MKACRRCSLPGLVPGAELSDEGICAFCLKHEREDPGERLSLRKEREADLEKALDECRGKGSYDCLVPLSGGKDSIYLLHKLKVDRGLKVLAFTTDMNLPPLAWRNIDRALRELDIEHISYRPPLSFYTRLFRHCLTNQEARGAVYTVSYVYAPLFEGDAIRIAVEKRIPLILAGYSPGQPDPARMEYEFPPEFIAGADWTPPELRSCGHFTEAELSYFHNAARYPEGTVFPRYLAPFHAWDYCQDEVIKEVVRLGLVKNARHASPVLSNYPINWLEMYSDLENFGYNPYHPEFAALIRQGKANLTYWKLMGRAVNFMIRHKIFMAREVRKSLKWLGLDEADLKITLPEGAYDPPGLAGTVPVPEDMPGGGRTICSLFRDRAERSPDETGYFRRNASGVWEGVTWRRSYRAMRRLACELRRAGLERSDKVGIMGRTSFEWDLAQLAVLYSGGIAVGLDTRMPSEVLDGIVRRNGISGLVVEEAGMLEKFAPEVRSAFKFIVAMRGSARCAGDVISMEKVIEGTESGEEPVEELSSPEDAALITFTSGTTGQPKSICYAHAQVTYACSVMADVFRGIELHKIVAWLPLSGLFQRVVDLCAPLVGASTYYVEDPRDIVRQLPSIEPDIMIGVPLFYERLYKGILDKVSRFPFWRRFVFCRAMDIGATYARACREKRRMGVFVWVAHRIAERLVLRRVRTGIGFPKGYMLSGSAPMPVWLLERFHAMGILILEAYGVSENIVPMAMNRPDAFKFGTVGRPLPGNDIVIADDGEILVKGTGVFSGYADGALPHGSFSRGDGYFSTGDTGYFDEEGYLVLKGRKDDMFKLASGKMVSPAEIEQRLRGIPYVDHVIVAGASRDRPIALFDLKCPEGISDNIKSARREMPSPEESVAERICRDVKMCMRGLPRYLQLAGLIVLKDAFSISGGELTSSLKPRRRYILDKYRHEIDEIYGPSGPDQGRPVDGTDIKVRFL